MKKFRKAIRELWIERSQILQALAYIGTVGWYGCILGIICNADINLFLTILLFVGGIVLGLFTCYGLHKVFTYEDE